jgi:hypothetical protein
MYRGISAGSTGAASALVKRLDLVCSLFVLLAVCVVSVHSQQLTGTISGTTYDQTGAVVPNAQVSVKNEASNDTRQTVSNASGFFTFSALQPGTYDVTVTAPGFQGWQQTGIVLNQGDNRTLPNIALQVGKESQQVEVVSNAEALAPVDTGEVSTTLNSHMVNDLTMTGRDAGELLKIMPGMALASGLSNGNNNAGFGDRVVGTNSGPIGAYSANGTQPNGAMAYMLDGANLLDPGNQGTQIANINQDMTAEVKVLMSGYDAAYAKGPVVFQAFSKSGGAQFHGEGYFYARNNIFNSVDAYQKSQGIGNVDAYEYYPGGNIGGPVLLPFTHFNHNRDKLFFWVGYEYMRQQPAGQLWQTFVPTPDMLAGDFSPAAMAKLPPSVSSHYGAITAAPCAPADNRSSCGGLSFPNGIIPTSLFDPNALALLKTYPAPNVDPATHDGNNFQFLDQSPQNRWEITGKVDYAVSENTKLTVSYSRQNETDLHPVQMWWAPSFSLPYPSPLIAPTNANVIMANATHVFSPTLTNETVFTYARYINPATPVNPKAIDPATYGFDVPGLFGAKRVQIPNILSWSGNGGFAGYDQQAVFGGTYDGGKFGKTATDPAIYDNLSKVAGTHTMKFGVYWDLNQNLQSSGGPYNGTYDFETYGGTTTGNLYADLLLGRAAGYSQVSAIPVDNLKYHQYSLYAQDSWKAGKRLTLNYGVRLDHMGQWYPDTKFGAAVWDLAAYQADPTAVNAGLSWHSINSHVPLSGFKSPLFYYEPRIGAAFDVFGNGKTVIRGGFAVFHYQIAYNLTSGPSELPEGVINYSTPAGITSLAQITTLSLPTGVNAACGTGCSVSPLQMNDGKTPYTENYNVSVDESLPGHMLAELSYVGNRSRDTLTAGGPFSNLNAPPIGSFFGPDPLTGVVNPIYMDNFPTNDYRPIQQYGDLDVSSHRGYANYNSLQATLQKQSGPVTFVANYTFSKDMGIRDNYSGNGPSDGNTVDPFNIKNNYGVLAYDHTHIFNTGYVWNLPSPVHSHWFAQGVVNGWTLSGTVQFQTGAPIQPNTNGNMYASYGNTTIDGHTVGVGTQTWLGSNASNLVLVPLLTCNPGSNLKSGQYFNPSCFAPPPQGSNGTLMWPNIHGPAYFNTDMALFKSFHLTERQRVEFRFSAFNFLNRPNPEFGAGGNNNDLTLNFNSGGPLSQTNTNTFLTGKPAHTVGDRLVEFAVKYYF